MSMNFLYQNPPTWDCFKSIRSKIKPLKAGRKGTKLVPETPNQNQKIMSKKFPTIPRTNPISILATSKAFFQNHPHTLFFQSGRKDTSRALVSPSVWSRYLKSFLFRQNLTAIQRQKIACNRILDGKYNIIKKVCLLKGKDKYFNFLMVYWRLAIN